MKTKNKNSISFYESIGFVLSMRFESGIQLLEEKQILPDNYGDNLMIRMLYLIFLKYKTNLPVRVVMKLTTKEVKMIKLNVRLINYLHYAHFGNFVLKSFNYERGIVEIL